jgi:hypothetical protein
MEKNISGRRGVKPRSMAVMALAASAASCVALLVPLSVRIIPESGGLHRVYFSPTGKMLDQYGAGDSAVFERFNKGIRSNVAGSKEEAIRAKNQAYFEAVQNYLRSNETVPVECRSSPTYVFASDFEGNQSVVLIRCSAK